MFRRKGKKKIALLLALLLLAGLLVVQAMAEELSAPSSEQETTEQSTKEPDTAANPKKSAETAPDKTEKAKTEESGLAKPAESKAPVEEKKTEEEPQKKEAPAKEEKAADDKKPEDAKKKDSAKEKDKDKSKEKKEPQTFTWNGGGITVTVIAPYGAFVVPVKLKVELLGQNQAVEQAIRAGGGSFDKSLALNICFTDESGSKTVQPGKEVSVTIGYGAGPWSKAEPDTVKTDSFRLWHISGSKVEAIGGVVVSQKDGVITYVTASASVKSFSLFALSWNETAPLTKAAEEEKEAADAADADTGDESDLKDETDVEDEADDEDEEDLEDEENPENEEDPEYEDELKDEVTRRRGRPRR